MTTTIIFRYFSIRTDKPDEFLKEMDRLCRKYAISEKNRFVYTAAYEKRKEYEEQKECEAMKKI